MIRADRVLYGLEVAQRVGLVRSWHCALGQGATWIIDVAGEGAGAYTTRAAEELLSRLASEATACER